MNEETMFEKGNYKVVKRTYGSGEPCFVVLYENNRSLESTSQGRYAKQYGTPQEYLLATLRKKAGGVKRSMKNRVSKIRTMEEQLGRLGQSLDSYEKTIGELKK